MFTPFALAKQSKPGKEIKEFFFPSFPENVKLCPVHYLSMYMYIERTKAIRGDNNQLFVSIIKPHGSITSSTIARWLKEVMTAAGIYTCSVALYEFLHECHTCHKDHMAKDYSLTSNRSAQNQLSPELRPCFTSMGFF